MSTYGPPEVVASGLAFPEGPVAVSDGSVIVTEIHQPRIVRIHPDGRRDTLAEWDDPATAGPNGAAIGPDGALYIANNGGFAWGRYGPQQVLLPRDPNTGASQAEGYVSGSIDRLDLVTGELTTVFTECNGHRLCGPNDLVVDHLGGMWVTDHGKRRAHDLDATGVYYVAPGATSISRPIFPLHEPNGVGLSPDGRTLYVAETPTGRLWAWDLEAPGQIAGRPRCLANTLGQFDSLAVEEDGTVVVAALRGGLCLVRPDGSLEYVAVPGPLTTNICFGGADRRTAYVTESGAGVLYAYAWPRPGLALTYTA